MGRAEQLRDCEGTKPSHHSCPTFCVGVYYEKKEDKIELRGVAASTKKGRRAVCANGALLLLAVVIFRTGQIARVRPHFFFLYSSLLLYLHTTIFL